MLVRTSTCIAVRRCASVQDPDGIDNDMRVVEVGGDGGGLVVAAVLTPNDVDVIVADLPLLQQLRAESETITHTNTELWTHTNVTAHVKIYPNVMHCKWRIDSSASVCEPAARLG